MAPHNIAEKKSVQKYTIHWESYGLFYALLWDEKRLILLNFLEQEKL